MILLGITNNDCSGAALIDQDRIRSSVSEERFNGKKDYNGRPRQSIEYVLQERGITLKEIDHVCYGWSTGFRADRNLELYLSRYMLAKERGNVEESIFRERIAAEIQNNIGSRTKFKTWADNNGLGPKVAYMLITTKLMHWAHFHSHHLNQGLPYHVMAEEIFNLSMYFR